MTCLYWLVLAALFVSLAAVLWAIWNTVSDSPDEPPPPERD